MNILSKEKRKPSVKRLFASSVIITFLVNIASAIYKRLEGGIFGGIFTAYDRECEAASESAAAVLVAGLDADRRFLHPAKGYIAKSFEESLILSWIRNMTRRLLACQVRVYGLFLFSFALYAALAYIFKALFVGRGEGTLDIGLVITLVMMVIASVGLISARCTLAEALLGSSASSFFLFHVVGLRRENLESVGESEGRFNVAFVAGLIFGAASYFISPVMLLIALGGLIAAYLVLISPEFGVLAIITLLPFAPTMGLVAAILYTSLCFFLKAVCGKRSLRFDLLDRVVLIFMILMIFGGIVALSRGSLKPMLVYVAFMLGYFLVVNLIRSREWLSRCIAGAVISGVIVSFYGIFQNFFGLAETTWQDADMFSSIKGRVVSTFENPNVLAEYLIMLLPLIFAVFIVAKSPKIKAATLLCFALSGGCLIYTWSRGAWLGFMIGMIIFMLMYSKKTLAAMLFCLLGVPFLPFVLPQSIIERFTSIGNLGDSSTSYRVYIWDGVISMLRDYFVTGIGIGNDSFKLVYPAYALSGIETAPHSHNLYLQITVELGIVGLVVFLALLFIWAQSCLTLHATEKRKTKLIGAGIFCGIFAVLLQGMTDYIWYNYRVFLMFWLMLGLSAAVRRVMRSTAEENIL